MALQLFALVISQEKMFKIKKKCHFPHIQRLHHLGNSQAAIKIVRCEQQ